MDMSKNKKNKCIMRGAVICSGGLHYLRMTSNGRTKERHVCDSHKSYYIKAIHNSVAHKLKKTPQNTIDILCMEH